MNSKISYITIPFVQAFKAFKTSFSDPFATFNPRYLFWLTMTGMPSTYVVRLINGFWQVCISI